MRLVLPVLLALAGPAWAGTPVRVVAESRLSVTTPAGTGRLPLILSRDWTRPQPEVTRALIVIHGVRRNADTYAEIARQALDAAGEVGRGTMLAVPQFLDEADAAAHALPPDTLRWRGEAWEGGGEARGPAPVSAFAALDAILARLADRALFPDLREIVVAGHSGGGQVAQRYAVLGRGPDQVARPGLRVRFVVANPSSYAVFTPDRPRPAASCPEADRWKYGMRDLPAYAGDAAPGAIEGRYVQRDVTYLLGTADTDPAHPALDRSCMAEAQGPTRLARGLAYVAALHARHPALRHTLRLVPGVGHDARGMFTAACGLAALFDTPGCPATPLP